MLVHELVVERADQDEVVQGRGPAVAPEADVVRLREATGAAPGEPALAIAVAELPDHPPRRLAGHRPHRNGVARLVFRDDLQPSVAPEPVEGLAMDGRGALDLSRTAVGKVGERRVHDDRGAILVGVDGDPLRAEPDQRVGAPGVHVEPTVFIRHDGYVSHRTFDRAGDDGTLRCGELRLEPEAATLVEVPPGQPAVPIHIGGLLFGLTRRQVAATSDRPARHAARP